MSEVTAATGTKVNLVAGKPKLWHKENDQLVPGCDAYMPPEGVVAFLSDLEEMKGAMSEEDIKTLVESTAKQDDGTIDVGAFLGGMKLPFSTYTPVLVDIEPPKGDGRAPVDICCVIDISGSMGMEATIQSAAGTTESHGLSLLDIAKHGLRTVMNSLGDGDRLSLVTFNHGSVVVFGLTQMDEAGRKMATAKLNEMSAGGGTNIWSGLEDGLNALRDGAGSGRIGHIMLLTDGQTMSRDSVMPNLKAYKDKAEGLPGTVSTFGFGYNIDSPLLDNIAHFGDGTYSFIPDAGFVGTVFVKTLSNLLVTIGREVTVALELEGCELAGVLGQHRMSTEKHVCIGTLQYEQRRSLVLVVKASGGAAPPNIGAKVDFETGTQKDSTEFAEIDLNGDFVDAAVEPELLRCRYIDTVRACLDHMKTSRELTQAYKMMADLGQAIQASPAADKEEIQALLQDVKGQSSEAVSKREWYEKWGVHYLPSIMFAHRSQQSNNFKDPSVQHYGGTVFNEMVDMADDIFNNLPAPEPSVRRPYSAMSYSSGGPAASGYTAPAQPVNMAAYNDRYGVCIDASCLVRLVATGSLKPVGELRQGDLVAAPGGETAEVACVVRTPCEGGKALLVELPGGARVTPFHPISWKGEWQFPADVAAAQEKECLAVCSVVLRGASALLVGFEQKEGQEDAPAIACVALGHGLEEGAAKHPYFGTQRVIEDLQYAPGYKNGLVEVRNYNVMRDIDSGLVRGFNFQE